MKKRNLRAVYSRQGAINEVLCQKYNLKKVARSLVKVKKIVSMEEFMSSSKFRKQVAEELTEMGSSIDLDAYELAKELSGNKKILAMLKDIDSKGHRFWKMEQKGMGNISAYTLMKLGREKLALIDISFRNGTPLPEFIGLGENSEMECCECGEWAHLETDGSVIRVAAPCKCSSGGTIEFELNVPSGVMVYADDFRPLFDIQGDFSLNYKLGKIKQSIAMARIGCANGFVGNSCPSIFKVNETTFVVGNAEIDKTTDEWINPPGEKIGSITTDTWSYSFVDAHEYKRRGGELNQYVDTLEVRPGVYKFTHNLQSVDEGYNPAVTYATFSWVREPDPVQDFLKEYNDANFTAGQVIAHKSKQWPSLYGGPKAAMKVANHIFCVVGSGGSWHPNGFVQYDPDMPQDTPDMEIPKFDQHFNWYPLSDYSAIVVASGLSKEKEVIRLNPSFAALARNVLTCMIKYDAKSSFQKDDSRSIKLARKCLVRINELYSEN